MNIIDILKQFISESDGKLSNTRALVSIVVLIQMCTWCYICITNNTLVSWDLPDIALIATAMGAKVIQKGKEIKKDVEK